MKRMMLTATLLGFIMLLAVPGAEAAPPDFGGGVNNEYDYEEVVFVSGTPVKFVGSGKDINIKPQKSR